MPIDTNNLSSSAWKDVFETIIVPKIPRGNLAWSIAELGLSDQAYRELISAFARMTGLDWEILTYGGRDDRDRAGLLLVVVMAEHARRYTRGDQIWSCMKQLPMRDCLRRRFFLSNGQPNRDLRQAIESAAYRWNLRHVFNIPGHMAWFVTLFLQFGFPLPAAERRLPFWLSGQILPVAVSYLQGGGMFSPSFVLMWQSLRAYRLNHITESKCREALERSPWVHREWIPVLLLKAKSRLDLVDLGDRGDGEEVEPLLLGEPCLIWPPGEEPFFRCEILAMATFELAEERYEIRSESFKPVCLVRQEDGAYYIVGASTVDVPLGRASVQCTLVEFTPGAGESDLVTQSVTLWDPHYPISLYRKRDGSKMGDPEHPVRLDEGSFAVFHETFTITPDALRAHNHRHWWLTELPPCEWQALALLQNGERVWWSDPSPEKTHEQFPVSISPRHAEALKWTTPDVHPEVEFAIHAPSGVELRWVRIGHEVIDFEMQGMTGARTDRFMVRPEHAVYPLYATIGFRANGQTHRVTQRVRFKAQACFLEKEGALSVYDPNRALNVRNARQFLFHILCPDTDNVEEVRRVWVLEGARIVRPIRDRGIQLTNLAGYGAPIDLYRGLYNTEEKLACLITRVRDNGVLAYVLFSTEGLFVKTCTPIEFDAKHELIAWTMDHRFLRLPIDALEFQEEAGHWFLNLSPWQDEQGRNPLIKAMGLFYEGRRLGNWFDKTYHIAITKIENEKQAACCAEMLRWFKAPILDSEVRGAMVFLLKRYPGEVIPVWLESGVSPDMQFAELPVEDEWLQVISTLVREIGVRDLTLADASQIIEAVAPDFSPADLVNSLPTVLARLDGIGANLVAKIAHLFLAEARKGEFGGRADALKRAILSQFKVSEEELERVCNNLAIDPFFVSHLFEHMVRNQADLTEADQHNRDLLLNHRLMRRLLTFYYLEKL